MRQIKHRATALAMLATLAALVSCANDDEPSGTEPSPATDAGSTTSATPDPDYTVVASLPLYGPGRWAVQAGGDPEAPLAVIDVPRGYQGREGIVWTHDELDLDKHPGQVLYQSPTRVHEDPCDAQRPSRRLGPTVEDLADALAAQRLTTTTRPVAASLDGYSGLYLELTTPDGLDLTACPNDALVVFESGADFERVLEWPTTERYWILDVEGRRVVITAMTPAGARGESVRRVTDVARTVTFVEAAM